MTKKDHSDRHDPFHARESEKYETPVPSREFILAQLTQLGEPVKRRALLAHFELESPELHEAFRRRLKAMVRDGQLLKTPDGYLPIVDQEAVTGKLVIEREGEGYVQNPDGERIYLGGPNLRGHFDGDEIEVQISQLEKDGTVRGRIVKLLTAATPTVVGRFVAGDSRYEMIPFDRKYQHNFIIPKDKKGKANNGDIVQVKILRDEKYQFHVEPVAEVIDILGDISSPGIEVKIALKKFNIPHEWPKGVVKENEQFKGKVPTLDKDHVDLTHLPLVTIDGEDAKDFDDAVYCEPTRKGWQLTVAIADVSYYVRPGSELDKEARNRGNSTYFPGSVVPMLPEALSNELCSLKPKVPRYCLVCQMDIDKHGEIKDFQFMRGMMLSKARLTYTEVAEVLNNNQILREKYAPLVKPLEDLHDLYQALNKQRKKRGAIDFETLETRILFDSNGKIKSIVPQTRNVAHKMIEESMLAANVCAAKFLQKHMRPTLFRIHDRPPAEKLTALRAFLSELGLDLPGRNEPTATDFSKLIHDIQDREDRHIIETVMLRSLSQAIYSGDNIGHFGLAYPSYLHFTSPIRRYPDLIVHRGIIDVLQGKSKKAKLDMGDVETIALQCSQTERRSDEATRDASMALKCHFMQDKVGEEFRGVISGVANFGVFVELKDIYIEGLVHVTGLGRDYFVYDPAHHRMVGERTRKVYRLGDPLEVRVVRVDVEAKKIDLELLDIPSRPRSEASKPKSKRPPRPKKGQRQAAAKPAAKKKSSNKAASKKKQRKAGKPSRQKSRK